MKKIIFFLVFVLIVHCTLKIEDCLAQWEPDVRLTNDPSGSFTSRNNAWNIASSGSVVHVVWRDHRDGNPEIYYKRSTDAGVTWGADTRLTNNINNSFSPTVSISGLVVHVLWWDYRDGNGEIYYKRSTDAGVSWGADTRLTNNIAESSYPSVAVSGTLVHVVWEDIRDGNLEIYYKRSQDTGVSWGADTRLTNNTSNSEYPSVAVSGSFVHVMWRDLRDGNYEIYYKRSTNGGVSWGTDTRLTNNTANSYDPSVSVSDSLVHVVWIDQRDGNYEIYYKRSTDVGVSWGADTRLTNNNAYSEFPSIAVSGSIVHTVWMDRRDVNYEIYYKRSTDGGETWGLDTRLTNDTAYSYFPSIAVSGNIVLTVWQDNRDGNYEIYYKRNPTGNPTGIVNINAEIPVEYSLSQNYPNPFNPSTKIKFAIPVCHSSGSWNPVITLKIFDLLGREVATLVNEQLSPGTYETEWNPSNYPSGVYFYTLKTNGYTETKKMILIK
jgi:hypothetical protein